MPATSWAEIIFRAAKAASDFSDRLSFIWAFADLLCGPCEPSQYGKVRCLEQVYRIRGVTPLIRNYEDSGASGVLDRSRIVDSSGARPGDFRTGIGLVFCIPD